MDGFTEMRGEAVLPWMALAAFFYALKCKLCQFRLLASTWQL
jgi:hypothetical protein